MNRAVYIFFVFTDKTKYVKLEQDKCNWNIKNTGTRYIPHYLIPVDELIDFDRTKDIVELDEPTEE